MTSFTERLEQADVRIEKMIWIPGATSASGGQHDDLFDMICDDLYDSKDVPEITARLPSIEGLLSQDKPDWDEVVECFIGVDGFFVSMSTPVPTKFYDDGGYSSSWGYCQLKYAYAETLDEIVDVAEKFKSAVMKSARAKAGVAA